MPMRPVLLAAIAATLLGGCGTSDRAHDVDSVAARFNEAIGQKDGQAACADLGEETKTKLEQQEGKACEEAILGLDLPDGTEIARTTVYVTNASVDLAEGGTAFLSETDAGWKISAAGCTPTEPDQPYECELEG
jgi:hypothetical protein